MALVWLELPPASGGSSVTSVTASGPIQSSGGLTPNISLNGTVADNKLNFSSAADATKLFTFDLSGQTTGTTLTFSPQITSNMVLHIPQVATAGGAGMALVQDETTGFIFGSGITSSIGAANSMMQLANATVANRAQIKLHSYFNGNSVAGVSTLTSRSGTIAVNAAVVAGQDYSKWTAQAGATTPGSAPISGTWSFKANTVNSLTVTSDFHLQLANLAGTLTDALYLTSEGHLLLGTSTDATNARILLKNGHVVSQQTTAPTTTINANAGTGATSTVSNATDSAGTVNLTLGSVGTLSSGIQTTVNFNTAYNVAPIVVLTPANATAASNTSVFGIYTTSTTSGFSVNFATAGVALSALQFSYTVIETQ